MNIPAVRQATADDRKTVVNIITLAFTVDPLNRWYLPGAERFLTWFPQLADVFVGPSIEAGACFLTSGEDGAAIWLPPGAEVDNERAEGVIGQAVPSHLLADAGELFAFLESSHPHDEDCWYLPLIGVDVAAQGRGLGAILMKHVTDLLDENGALGYLESSNPKNVSLYERHGFEVIDQKSFGDSPLISPMVRARRSA